MICIVIYIYTFHHISIVNIIKLFSSHLDLAHSPPPVPKPGLRQKRAVAWKTCPTWFHGG